MKNLKLSKKIYSAICIIFFFILLFFISIELHLQKKRLTKTIALRETLLKTLVERDKEPLANEVFDHQVRAIKIRLSKMLEVDGVLGIHVYDKSGQLLQAEGDFQAKANLDEKELLISEDEISILQTKKQKINILIYFQEIRLIGEKIGFIKIFYSINDEINEQKAALIIYITLLIIILLSMVAVLNFILRRAVLYPITSLRDTINRIDIDSLGEEIEINNNDDEIGELTSAFNKMSLDLYNSYKEIESSKNELMQEKQFIDVLINSLPGIFYVYDKEQLLVKWNKNHKTKTGYNSEELSQMHFQDWFDGTDREKIVETMELIMDGLESEVEANLITKNGTKIPYFFTGKYLPKKDGDCLVGVGIDITERKKAEKKNQELAQQLLQTQKLEAIGTLAGGIAHDFNNILSGIFGFSHLARTHIDNPEKAKGYIDQLTKGAQKATELVQQILLCSRKSKPEKHPLEISLVIKEALKLLRSSIPTTIVIKDNIISKATVLADPTQIHQIIMNLCTNAYHAMFETGGVLAVSLKEIEISDKDTLPGLAISPGNYIKLEVSDDGHGMDTKILDKIFEPYFTTKEKGQGTGLGLSVVIGIIEEHNGFIRVYSEPGHGTTFHIYLPIIDKKAVSYTFQEKEEVLVGGTERIMVVDDDETILKVMHEILKDYGYKVSLFTNGTKALEEFEKDPHGVDLIITDMTMPVMTGLELSKKIFKLKSHQPIILCTGHSELINKEKAIAMGISEYFEKPVIAKKIIKIIRMVLDKKKDKD